LWSRWSWPCTPSLLRGRVVAVGFASAEVYWAWPSPAPGRASIWFQPESPTACGYFLDALPYHSSILDRVRQRVLRTGWQLAHRIQLLGSLYLLARKPGGAGAEAEEQKSWLMQSRSQPAHRLTRVLLAPGHESVNKVICLLFEEGCSQPLAAIKYPRIPQAIPGLRQEASALRALQSLRPKPPSGVPRLLYDQSSGPKPMKATPEGRYYTVRSCWRSSIRGFSCCLSVCGPRLER
jgi:hypothetical protein